MVRGDMRVTVTTRSSGNTIFMIFISSGFAFFGCLFALFGILALEQESAAQSWPTVEGKIITSKVTGRRKKKDVKKQDAKKKKAVTKKRTKAKPVAKIVYRYKVNGKKYTSNIIAFSKFDLKMPNDPTSLVLRYSKGKKVTVYYNPDDLSEAVLEPGGSKGGFVFIIVGLLFIAVADHSDQ